jgi:Protein of unknown function (DUF2958)
MRLDPRDLNHLPPVYGQEDVSDPIVHEHITVPGAAYNLYLTEYSERAPDGYPRLGFGYVSNGGGPGFDELGYVSFDELMSVRGPFGQEPERDESWKPVPLSEVKREIEQQYSRDDRGFEPELDFGGGYGIEL